MDNDDFDLFYDEFCDNMDTEMNNQIITSKFFVDDESDNMYIEFDELCFD